MRETRRDGEIDTEELKDIGEISRDGEMERQQKIL